MKILDVPEEIYQKMKPYPPYKKAKIIIDFQKYLS